MTGAERAARECVKVVADALIEIGYDRDKVECEEMGSAYLEFAPVIERAIEESRGQRWIPVEEKLPELNARGTYQTVIVYDSYWDSRYLALYVEDHWETVDERAEPIQISHWMPIADPPKVSPAKSTEP